MKKYDSFTEQLMLVTVLIETSSGKGTGFFYSIDLDDGKKSTILITNKHVINDNADEEVTIQFHLHQGKHNALESRTVKFKTKWIFHSTMDICFCFINPINEKLESIINTHLNIISISRDYIIDNCAEYAPLDELVMVGYPIGLYNQKYNYPIFRKGYIASDPSVDYSDDQSLKLPDHRIGIVDMACFPGSSGSPIFIYDKRRLISKGDGSFVLLPYQPKLLGILFAGPRYNVDGTIVIKSIPTVLSALINTRIMTNLGYYIKSQIIFELEDLSKMIISNNIESLSLSQADLILISSPEILDIK